MDPHDEIQALTCHCGRIACRHHEGDDAMNDDPTSLLREAWLEASGATRAQGGYYEAAVAELDRVINRVEADAIAGFVNYLAGRFEDQISLTAAQHMISDYLEGGER